MTECSHEAISRRRAIRVAAATGVAAATWTVPHITTLGTAPAYGVSSGGPPPAPSPRATVNNEETVGFGVGGDGETEAMPQPGPMVVNGVALERIRTPAGLWDYTAVVGTPPDSKVTEIYTWPYQCPTQLMPTHATVFYIPPGV